MRIAIIQLARMGDIVSILPVARHLHEQGNEVTLIAHGDFEDIATPCSYLTIHRCTTTHRDVSGMIALAKRMGFERIIASQVDGNDPVCYGTENFITEQWARAGHLEEFHDLPLVFDRRDTKGEARSLGLYMPPEDGRPLLCYSFSGHSSPYPRQGMNEVLRAQQAQWVIQTFGESHRLLDIGNLLLTSVHHLLAFLERAAVLLTIDSLPLHLAYATSTPTIALQPDEANYGDRFPYYQSEPRKHWIEKLNYTESMTPDGRNKIACAVREASCRPLGTLCRTMEQWRKDRIVHIVGWDLGHPQQDRRRMLDALRTWESARNAENNFVLILSENQKAARSSKSAFADTRICPFVHDLLDTAERHSTSDRDILLLTNADICLTPEASSVIRSKLLNAPCCFSRRIDVNSSSATLTRHMLRFSPVHPGTDLFACHAGWWKENKHRLPDLVLGCEGWDFVMRHIMLQDNPQAEITPPIIYHERHTAFWTRHDQIKSNPGQMHNRGLCKQWAIDHGYAGAIQDIGTGLFKIDGTFKIETKAAAAADCVSAMS